MAVKKVAASKPQIHQIQAPKGKGKAAEVQEQKVHSTLSLIVEDFAKVDLQIKEIQNQPIFADHQVKKEQLLLALDDEYASDQNGKVYGLGHGASSKPTYGVDFSVKKASTKFGTSTMDRVTALKAIHKLLGDEVFYTLASLPMTELKKYVPEVKLNGYLTVERDGARTVKGFEAK